MPSTGNIAEYRKQVGVFQTPLHRSVPAHTVRRLASPPLRVENAPGPGRYTHQPHVSSAGPAGALPHMRHPVRAALMLLAAASVHSAGRFDAGCGAGVVLGTTALASTGSPLLAGAALLATCARGAAAAPARPEQVGANALQLTREVTQACRRLLVATKRSSFALRPAAIGDGVARLDTLSRNPHLRHDTLASMARCLQKVRQRLTTRVIEPLRDAIVELEPGWSVDDPLRVLMLEHRQARLEHAVALDSAIYAVIVRANQVFLDSGGRS